MLRFGSKYNVSNEYLFYDLLLEHLVSWHGYMDPPTHQNIGKEIVWGHDMMGCMLHLCL